MSVSSRGIARGGSGAGGRGGSGAGGRGGGCGGGCGCGCGCGGGGGGGRNGVGADDGGGPAVVGRAARGALDGVDHVEATGELVAGDGGPAVFLDALERGCGPTGTGLDDGGHGLAPALVGSAA